MNPCFHKVEDTQLFYKYLNKAKNYFEFGSGGSTYKAIFSNNIEKIYSVESDLKWIETIKKNVNDVQLLNKIVFLYIDMQTVPNNFGYPGVHFPISEYKNYSNTILKYKNCNIDLILIDGRFRVACCLKCFDVIDNNCFILFDDFLWRDYYHVVLEFYEIVEKTAGESMVVLIKKNVKSPDKNLIEKYEKISS
jgi:protein O-GlcNAc transferase